MSPIFLSSSVLVLLVTRISCLSLPAELEDDCQLEEEDHLQCLHLNSSQWAGLSLLPPDLTRLDIQRSDLSCLDLSSLSHLTSLAGPSPGYIAPRHPPLLPGHYPPSPAPYSRSHETYTHIHYLITLPLILLLQQLTLFLDMDHVERSQSSSVTCNYRQLFFSIILLYIIYYIII